MNEYNSHMVFNEHSSLPLHLQISELLTREIAAGRYAAGDRLPPESELAARLKVAVGTLRKALAELQARGLVARRQGSGTYVKSLHTSEAQSANTAGIYGFFKLELLQGGGLPSALVIGFDCMPTPEAFRPHFSAQCYRLRRLRSLSNLPMAIEDIYFDAEHHPSLTRQDLGEALYLFYQTRLGFWISRVEDRLGLGAVPDWSPSLFEPAPNAPCPRIDRVAWSGKNRIEEYSITWFDAERCRYVNRQK
jgi:GntR family transcriptional regulator